MTARPPADTTDDVSRESRFLRLLAGAAAGSAGAVSLGLAVGVSPPFAAPVWPVSGLALAVLLIYGIRLWPGLAVGAFIAFAASGLPTVTSAAMTAVVTGEAVLGWWLLARRFPTGVALDRLRDVVRFVVLGSKVSTLGGAMLATAVLAVFGEVPAERLWATGLVIWLGHALGVIVVAPVVLTWVRQAWPDQVRNGDGTKIREGVVIGVLTLAATFLVFATPLRVDAVFPKWSYLVFPFALWAAARLYVHGASAACAMIASVAVLGTVNGLGPFAGNLLLVNLLSLQAFLAVLVLSSLTLAASVVERERAHRNAEDARRREESANQAKSMFLASASHDLRQPLNALSLYCDLLRSRQTDGSNGEVLDRIDESVKVLVDMFDGLLDVSKLELGVTPVEQSAFPVNLILEQIRKSFVATAVAKGLRLKVVESRAMVQSDPILLGRIIHNFVANAVTHTKQGGVVVGCRDRDGGRRLRIEVVDTGPGIAPQHVTQIFEDYYQVGNPERRRSQGYGLGLAIVRRAATLLGCQIVLESKVGRGSCFAVEVPRVGSVEPPADAAQADRGRPVRLRGLPVLVVEDDPAVREAMRHVLDSFGCTVRTAECADQALVRLAEGMVPKLVIADLRLPGSLDGVDTVGAIRERIGPVLACIISGDVNEAVRRRVERHVGEFLPKPVNADRLRAVLVRAAS